MHFYKANNLHGYGAAGVRCAHYTSLTNGMETRQVIIPDKTQSMRMRKGNRPRRGNLRFVFHLKLSTSLITSVKAIAIIAVN